MEGVDIYGGCVAKEPLVREFKRLGYGGEDEVIDDNLLKEAMIKAISVHINDWIEENELDVIITEEKLKSSRYQCIILPISNSILCLDMLRQTHQYIYSLILATNFLETAIIEDSPIQSYTLPNSIFLNANVVALTLYKYGPIDISAYQKYPRLTKEIMASRDLMIESGLIIEEEGYWYPTEKLKRIYYNPRWPAPEHMPDK